MGERVDMWNQQIVLETYDDGWEFRRLISSLFAFSRQGMISQRVYWGLVELQNGSLNECVNFCELFLRFCEGTKPQKP
jgi:hypothetical protein